MEYMQRRESLALAIDIAEPFLGSTLALKVPSSFLHQEERVSSKELVPAAGHTRNRRSAAGTE